MILSLSILAGGTTNEQSRESTLLLNQFRDQATFINGLKQTEGKVHDI